MVARDTNHDIVHPMLRPDLDVSDKRLYEEMARELEFDPSLKDKDSYMQFMCYNQFSYLKFKANLSEIPY